jgi:hypothetical protein
MKPVLVFKVPVKRMMMLMEKENVNSVVLDWITNEPSMVRVGMLISSVTPMKVTLMPAGMVTAQPSVGTAFATQVDGSLKGPL